ncbi:cadmium-translocating P-type ATPase [Candidatus Daviesbacteria bacterium]|nr:cadmium-translocating P-type ATPase [Candidatus Daviesbacteria bacterium]
MYYSCPMDPEVISKKPGNCPKCGMELMPITKEHGGLDHANMEEGFKRRFFVTLPLVFIIVVLAPKIQEWFRFSLTFPGMEIVTFALTSVIVFYSGLPFYQMALGEIKAKKYGMMTLVSLAVLSGYFFSVAATFLFPGENLYWEIATLVLAFLLGHWIEMRAVRGATGALAELARLIPPTAHKIVISGKRKVISDVGTGQLKKGDLILVRPGEKMPIDGVVWEGESAVNESMVTGESVPVEKKKGSEVIGGTINSDGSLTVKVTKTGEETAISQMMELIRQAQESKPDVQKMADQAASWLTFTALTVGIGTFLFWFFGSNQGAIFAGTLAISVIVIACPHALGLAIPTVTTITTALAAKNGILIKDMRALEIARKLNWVVLDKTGTLTEGKFGVSDVATFGKISSVEIINLATALEFHSQHPIAQGIVEEAKKRRMNIQPAKNFKSIPGKGAEGLVDGKKVVVGNQALMEDLRIKNIESRIKGFKQEGKTFIFVAINNRLVGAIGLEDVIRPQSKEAIDAFREMGIKTAMLTGDHETVAKMVAERLGIDTFFAQVLPGDKVSKIKQLQEGGNVVAMVGDGINDAASLTQAHIGIAIGAGTGVAIESAEIVLMKNDPRDVVKAIKLSQKTNIKMVQNLAWAAGYNIITIPMAAGIFYNLGILLRPEWAALLMSASSVIVVFNALLLKKERLD